MLVSIVIPVYNEEKILEDNIKNLLNFLKNPPQSPFMKGGREGGFQIIISDNASTDKTPEIAKNLEEKFAEVQYLRLEQRGKGLAISEGWKQFPAQPPLTPPISTKSKQGENVGVYMFMDADLSCDLNDIHKFINAINPTVIPRFNRGIQKIDSPVKPGNDMVKKSFDIACGSRHLKDSKDNRTFIRKVISKIWNLLPKIIIGTKLTDTACGIKAVNQRVVDEILPKVKNYQWFFDTELVLRAEKESMPSTSSGNILFPERNAVKSKGQKQKFKIVEIPIAWTENKDRKSKVSFFKVGMEYIRNLIRLKFEFDRN